jgi:hypothetical protein
MNKSYILFAVLILLGAIVFFGTLKKDNHRDKKETVLSHAPMSQSHKGYAINLLSPTDNLTTHKEITLRYTITDDTGAVVKNFIVDHTKIMHFILVRQDLQDFQHLHPDFNKDTGEFTIPVVFADNGPYRLFADFVPAQGQKQEEYVPVTIPTDVMVGDKQQYTRHSVVADTQLTRTEGSYEFTYSIAQPISVGKETAITLNVKKNGSPVTSMEEYLGAQAHGILLKKDSLAFAHLHAMGGEMTHMMDGKMMTMHEPMPKGPKISFDYTFPEAGVYKLFTQFQHEGNVITTDYVVTVQ